MDADLDLWRQELADLITPDDLAALDRPQRSPAASVTILAAMIVPVILLGLLIGWLI